MATSSLLGKRKYCSHCKENVSLATYRQHCEQASSQGLNLIEADEEEVQVSDEKLSIYTFYIKSII